MGVLSRRVHTIRWIRPVFILAQSYLPASLYATAYRKSRVESEINFRQSEENRNQNDFIKNILRNASNMTHDSSISMVSILQLLNANANEQASSTEEVAASIEEITAEASTVSLRTDEIKKSRDEERNAVEEISRNTESEGNPPRPGFRDAAADAAKNKNLRP